MTKIKKSSIHKIAVEYLRHYRHTHNRLTAGIRTGYTLRGNLYCFFQDKQAQYRKYWRKNVKAL